MPTLGRLPGAKDVVSRKYKFSFARQYLQDHGIRMVNGDKPILEPINTEIYEVKLPNTRFYIGEVFADEGELKKITSYEALKDLGFLIISTPMSRRTRWIQGQKVMYELIRVNETGEHINKIPKEHYVEYDPSNKVARLCGPRAGPLNYGLWLEVEKKVNARKNAGAKMSMYNISENVDKLIDRHFAKLTGTEEKPKPIYVPEAAFMITEANEIVCIPNNADMPSILISGMRGSGKCILQDEENDFVANTSGKLMKIEDKPKEVFVVNDEMKIETAPVKDYFKREANEIIEIKTMYEKKIKVTPEHLILTPRGWIEAGKLKKGNFVAAPRKYDFKNAEKADVDNNTIKLIAYICGLGRIQKDNSILFKRIDPEVYEEITSAFKKFSSSIKIKDIFNKAPSQTYVSYSFNVSCYKEKDEEKSELTEFLESMDLLKPYDEQTIPKIIFELNEEQVSLFLSTYVFVCLVQNTSLITSILATIYVTTNNADMFKQLNHLFLKLGILLPKSFKITNKYYTRINYKSDCEKLYNLGLKYLDEQIFQSKRLILQENLKKASLMRDDEELKLKQQGVTGLLTWEEFEKYKRQDITWIKIISLKKKTGTFTVWDMEIDHPSHNFIANDIVVHNSFAVHSLVSRLFWKPEFDYKICILNDSSRETGTWCLPNSDNRQINVLKRLNEKPLPLPCIYLHPLVKDDYEKLYMGNVGFDVTIPFKEIIDRHKIYLNLKDSGRYFTKIVDEIRNAATQKQAEEILDTMVLQHGVPPQTANKIIAEFETLFDSKMTDISTPGQAQWSTSKNYSKKYNPLTAAIHAGLLPVLETEFVSNQKNLLSIYFTYFVSDLFNRQKQDEDFLEEMSELMLVVDEAHNISAKGTKSGADMLLRRCVREGRPRRIGTLLATQKFNELPDVIKDNTSYLIVFKNPGEAAQIASQYNLGKHMVDVIKDLDKHQCLAYTTEHFIIYDSYGRRRKSKLNEVFVGKTLPPYSLHKRPNKDS